MKRVTMGTVVLLLAGCGGLPGEMEARTSALGFGNNADVANPMIVRFDGTIGQIIIGEDLFALQASTSRQFGCATAQFYNAAQIQQIIHDPLDPIADEIHHFVRARDIFIAVYRGNFWELPGVYTRPNPEFCAEVMTRRLGTGLGNAIMTDNDLYTYLREPDHANAYGVMGQGTIDIEGAPHRYSGVERCVYHPGGEFNCVNRVNLTP